MLKPTFIVTTDAMFPYGQLWGTDNSPFYELCSNVLT